MPHDKLGGRRYAPKTINSIICRVCGQPYGQFHDAKKCADLWEEKCDEEARKAKGGHDVPRR
jgi:hypothetical protein